MRLRTSFLLPLAAALVLAVPATASADFLHVISPGESLSSVAATDGLTVAQLAAANGLSSDASLISGTTLAIPPQSGVVEDVSPDSSVAGAEPAAAAAPGETAYEPGGSYVVEPGDTLSAIAAREGMSVATLAAINGLNPNDYLLSGSVLSFAGGGATAPSSETTSAAASQPVGEAAEGSPASGPYPTDETVSSSEIGSIAAANGVPASLADAIGWQESGFNNDEVSSADAVGVMQILPGTWQWINSSLAQAPLSPASAESNVTGGVLMLHSLLDSTGGSESMAAAGYYQGLSSVEQNGMYPSTQQYVNDVLSLTSSFGG